MRAAGYLNPLGLNEKQLANTLTSEQLTNAALATDGRGAAGELGVDVAVKAITDLGCVEQPSGSQYKFAIIELTQKLASARHASAFRTLWSLTL